jgi:prolyl 4-hydroxylase
VLHYQIAQEYKPHYDYFPPSKVDLAKGGQRAATFLLYLNDVADGGGQYSQKWGHRLFPKRGQHYISITVTVRGNSML